MVNMGENQRPNSEQRELFERARQFVERMVDKMIASKEESSCETIGYMYIGSITGNFCFASFALAANSGNGGKKSALSDVDLGSCAPKSGHQLIKGA